MLRAKSATLLQSIRDRYNNTSNHQLSEEYAELPSPPLDDFIVSCESRSRIKARHQPFNLMRAFSKQPLIDPLPMALAFITLALGIGTFVIGYTVAFSLFVGMNWIYEHALGTP